MPVTGVVYALEVVGLGLGLRALVVAALASGVAAVVFDRGGNQYHGRVAAIADGAREGGLSL